MKAASRTPGRTGAAAVFVALLCFTAGGVIARGVHGSPIAATGVRLAFIGPTLALISLRRPRPTLTGRLIISGGVFGVAAVLSQLAFQKTSLANATLIPAAAPVLLGLIEVLARRKGGARRLVTAAIAASAIAVFIVAAPTGAGRSLSGDLAALGYLGCWCVYLTLISAQRQTGADPIALTATVMMVAALPVNAVALATGAFATLTSADLVRCAAIGVLSTLIGQTLVVGALRTTSPTTVGSILLLQPVLSALAGWLLFGEEIGGLWRWISAAAVLGVLISTLIDTDRNREPEPGSSTTPTNSRTA